MHGCLSRPTTFAARIARCLELKVRTQRSTIFSSLSIGVGARMGAEKSGRFLASVGSLKSVGEGLSLARRSGLHEQ